MESVILTTPFLLILSIISVITILVIMVFKESKITPFVAAILTTATVIGSLFFGAELIEVLIYVLILFSLFGLTLLLRFKK